MTSVLHRMQDMFEQIQTNIINQVLLTPLHIMTFFGNWYRCLYDQPYSRICLFVFTYAYIFMYDYHNRFCVFYEFINIKIKWTFQITVNVLCWGDIIYFKSLQLLTQLSCCNQVLKFKTCHSDDKHIVLHTATSPWQSAVNCWYYQCLGRLGPSLKR